MRIKDEAMGQPLPMTPAAVDLESRAPTWRRGVLGLLFTYHALAVTLSTLIPVESHLHAALEPFFRGYLTVSGSEQIWNMFTSAPYYASYDVVLIAEDRTGGRHEYGPVLPGLRAYDQNGYRDHKLFSNLATPGYASALRAYFETARRAIQTQHGTAVRSLRLRFKTERLYYVKRVREAGHISFPEVTETEPRRWLN
jgi:hypothetical protein